MDDVYSVRLKRSQNRQHNAIVVLGDDDVRGPLRTPQAKKRALDRDPPARRWRTGKRIECDKWRIEECEQNSRQRGLLNISFPDKLIEISFSLIL